MKSVEREVPAPEEGLRTLEQTERLTVTATEAKNEFGRVLDSTARNRIVVITKHNTPRAVLMSMEKFEALSRTGDVALEALTDEFDALLERMQSPNARAGMKRAFEASAEELGRAATAAAEQQSSAG